MIQDPSEEVYQFDFGYIISDVCPVDYGDHFYLVQLSLGQNTNGQAASIYLNLRNYWSHLVIKSIVVE